MEFSVSSFGFQGDQEAPQLLERLARRNPDVEWVIVGKNDRHTAYLPENVTNPWPDEPWFRNGPVEHISVVKPNRMHLVTPLSRSYVVNNMRSYEFEQTITELIADLDGIVLHVGQHGTSSMVVPQIGHTWADLAEDPEVYGTNPQAWTRNYERFLIEGINRLGDRTNGRAPVVWIVTDPRNYIKTRSIKWPSGLDDILAQYQYERVQRHQRFQDARDPKMFGYDEDNRCIVDPKDKELWRIRHTYRYGGLELMILPDDWETWGPATFDERVPAGIASTSFARTLSNEPRRSELIRDVLLTAFPDAEVWGKWDDTSLADVPDGTVRQNKPHEFPSLLNRWRVTLSLPALGSGWTVAKPYQVFAANVVCFMWGRLDEQGWVLPTRRQVSPALPVDDTPGRTLYSVRDDWTVDELALAHWLRVETVDEFQERATRVAASRELYEWIIETQRNLLMRRWNEAYLERQIEHMLGIEDDK